MASGPSSGGFTTRADLIGATSRASVDAALRHGDVVATTRGRYALPETCSASATAHDLSATLCPTSAALHHGWEVRHVPDRQHVALARGRKLDPRRTASAVIHRHDLHHSQIDGVATSRADLVDTDLRILEADSFAWQATARHRIEMPTATTGWSLMGGAFSDSAGRK